MISFIKNCLSTEATDDTRVQFIRYTFVGGLAFLVDFGSLWAFTDGLGIHYLTSAALAFLLGLTTNYLISVRWVFSKRAVKSAFLEFMIFTGVGLVGLLWNELFMWLFTGIIGIHYLWSKILSTVFVYMWNFIVRKFALFN